MSFNQKMCLNKGTEVEVTSDDDGFRGVWYVAKIMEAPEKKSGDDECFVVVEYNELISEEDESKKLSERVNVSYVRPLPPPPPVENEVIEVNDVVDVYHKDGWWVGVVEKIVELDKVKKFVVCFDDPPDKMAVKRLDVRLHFDWLDGKWEKPHNKSKKKKKDSGRFAMLSNQSGNSKRQNRMSKRQQAGEGCESTEKKDNTGVHVDIVEKECIAEVVKGALSAKDYETSLKKGQKTQSRDREITNVDVSDELNGSTQGDVISKRKRGRSNLLFKKQIGEGSTGAKRSLPKTVRNDSCVGDETEINAENDCLMHTTVDKSNEYHFQPSGKDSMKVTADKIHTSDVHKHNDLLSETAIIPLPEDQGGETVPSKRVKRPENSLSNEHEGMSKMVDNESQYQECHNASRGSTLPEITHAKDVDMLVDGSLGDENDDQVINSSLQLDKPSPTGSDASRTLPVQRQCAVANGRQDDFGTPPVAKNDRMDNTDGPNPGDLPVNNLNQADSEDKNGELGTPASVSIDNMENGQSLPFIKCSPLWKAIESMEIYKKAQKPHFSPLVKCNEEAREGLAIAHMVNFSNLVEKTSKLQFSHPITFIERSLETLAELESNGFGVETIRACLTQLLSKKQMGEELQNEYKDIENEISNSVNEKDRVDEEITQLNQKMKELSAKLGEALSRKEMKETVISTLKSKQGALKSKQGAVSENVQSLQLDFQNIAGSLCQ